MRLLKYIGPIVCACFFTLPAVAAELLLVEEKQFGDWTAALLENVTYNRLLCIAETEDAQGTIFRLVFYLDGDAFLEILNEAWTLREVPMKFILDATQDQLHVPGYSVGNGLIHDFIDQENTALLLGFVALNNSLNLKNSNGSVMARFSLTGSSDAIRALSDCLTANGSRLL